MPAGMLEVCRVSPLLQIILVLPAAVSVSTVVTKAACDKTCASPWNPAARTCQHHFSKSCEETRRLGCDCSGCCFPAAPTSMPSATSNSLSSALSKPQQPTASKTTAAAASGRVEWIVPGGGHQGACSDSMGPPDPATYDEMWGLTSKLQCQEKCDKKRECTAYEWGTFNNYKRCRLFSTTIVKTIDVASATGLACLVKRSPPSTVHAGAATPWSKQPSTTFQPGAATNSQAGASATAPSGAVTTSQPGAAAVAHPPSAASPPLSCMASLKPCLKTTLPCACCSMASSTYDFSLCSDLTNAYMPGANLANANMETTVMSNACFDGAKFGGSTWIDVVATGSNFRCADMSLVKADGVDLSRSDFTGSTCTECDFHSSTLDGVKFDGAKLNGAVMAEATSMKSSFKGAQLQGADFSMTDLSGSDFSGANVARAVFHMSNLAGTKFTGAVGLDTADFGFATGNAIGLNRAMMQPVG
mmetsp:Transcript_18611/g.31130  ORF Transcript_18611/g.31130 Transcript_18611/m.31130 type:complete len:473 (-) Transcript_18611:687-2105(-)|eukprot:CAMPEP_0119311664 /NCGR_PEP_ID=MMETSP1333-20130426/23296_1 /TAXON_ID=418940 /ORGANISM="Scyphosphaera apsteinii, Strain RCC1455" /LENGTH=472 /DNA_ID=CAMNT_0007316099 /DNA_START=31 /DNA_END=1449 /DNA_ORIENTATION=+